MNRSLAALGPLALPALLAWAAGCGGIGEREESQLRLFNRIAYCFERYNAALDEQDDALKVPIGRELARLADGRFEDVAAGLASEDARRQSLAAFALGFSKNSVAAGLLARAAGNPIPAVRANAAAALGMLAVEDVPTKPLVDLLKDPEPQVRQAALFGLCSMLSETRDRGLLETVHGMLGDPAMDVRNEALIVLRKLRRKESVPVILGKPVKDADPLVRSNAAAALGAIGRDAADATPALIEMLRDDVPKAVESAWVALKAIHQKDLDRSYGGWRGWYDDEVQNVYVCPDHKDVSQAVPGECPQCKAKLDRMPRDAARKSKAPEGPFACPDHPEVMTSTPGKCGRTACGKDLVPREAAPAVCACPSHPEVQTATPGRCGKPACGKDLVPRK